MLVCGQDMINTRRQIQELRKANPCLPAAEIARKLDISRERVRQLLLKTSLPTKLPKKKPIYYCLVCDKPIPRKYRFYCSRACQYKDHHVLVACAHCGKLKELGKFDLLGKCKINTHIFCSHSCSSLWFWDHSGLRVGRRR